MPARSRLLSYADCGACGGAWVPIPHWSVPASSESLEQISIPRVGDEHVDRPAGLGEDTLDGGRHGRVIGHVHLNAMSAEEASLADYAAIMDVNFMGALRLVKAVLPAMRARGAGRILGTSSVGGVVGFPFGSPYAASKFAMEGFWESCHAEYKAAGVHFALVRAPCCNCGGLSLCAGATPCLVGG